MVMRIYDKIWAEGKLAVRLEGEELITYFDRSAKLLLQNETLLSWM